MFTDEPCNVYTPFVTSCNSMADVKGERWQKFGAWLKSQREGQRYSQAGAAKRAGIDRQQWYRIESGRSGTKHETVIAIANALSLDVNDALQRAGYAPSSPMNKKPETLHELLRILESLGVENVHFGDEDRLRTATPDELQQVLDAVRVAVEVTLQRNKKLFDVPHIPLSDRAG